MDPELTRLMTVLDQASGRLGDSYSKIAALQAEVAAKDRALAHRSRLEMLGRMAATLAHEIRNPLGGIQLYASMLRRDGHDPETCDRILAAVADLNRLVEDMLVYGRDAEPIKLPHELGAIADEAVALAGIEGRVRVVRRYGEGRALVDAEMMRRAFLNLAMNAEGETLAIETSPRRVVFRDSGPGIPADVLPHLFTPFFTTRAQGTGLGLAIAQKIVEAHGGTIAAANVEPHGAEFVITL